MVPGADHRYSQNVGTFSCSNNNMISTAYQVNECRESGSSNNGFYGVYWYKTSDGLYRSSGIELKIIYRSIHLFITYLRTF